MDYPVPHNEAERLEALHKLKILDTESTPEFDAIVALAAAAFEVPMAFISFVDRDVQWFKAKFGFDGNETCRDNAFCNYTLVDSGAHVVEDATQDERFRDNPLVTGEPFVRFYAGIPLSLDGKINIGSLCVVDTKPRRVTKAQLNQLTQLRDIVVGLVRAHVTAIEAKSAERNARQRRKLLSQVERMSEIGAWSLDTGSFVTIWSPQVFAIHELAGTQPPSLEEAIAFYPEDERERLTQKINACIEYGTSYEIECDFITAKGNKRRVRSIAEIEHGEDGTKFLIGIIKDITDQHEQEQKLWHAANLDSMTGIANRHYFHSEIEKRLNADVAENDQIALLMIDLDNFKNINDNLGHLAGDQVLRTVARRIDQSIPGNAFCARLGGDEFAVLLTTLPDTQIAEELATKLVDKINLPIKYEQHEIRVGASIGVSTHDTSTATEDDLFLKSDLALYHVKQNGRCSVKVYDPAITDAFEEKRQSVLLVRSAITKERLEPHYQPIIDLKTQEISGVEALARIRNNDGTVSGPADFWHALCEPQSAREIDEVMLDLALRDFSLWKSCGLDIDFVSINASSSCIQSDAYADRVLKGLTRHGLSPSDLKIEVVESVFLGNESLGVRNVLERLSTEGIRIALDDFGTGFASLSHLRDYPINCIKIDKSFVLGLGQNSSNTAIVQALVGLGRSMDLEVIAEGIETQGQLEFVSALGSHFGQGYYYARPMDAQSLAQFLGAKSEMGSGKESAS
ncbi:PAS domain S-box/diguanylate cyclase (GGDEF) domain-containing protein [Hoeflea sp. IMCC20628]|uniref:sensor domain-containing phosphodiesterase n=1 Tax=Hoeflea sp. IMCC20628 TaxID=1620421 RepID=UPI00063BD357|nr:EAL domain-containing protein [Hoeflea sp. IMCC20628]AKI02284.1 PAS domain S-box/diguanylate cyclase (GGDEF) domain-containing protein [Hoeflea sp. IMCC20628]